MSAPRPPRAHPSSPGLNGQDITAAALEVDLTRLRARMGDERWSQRLWAKDHGLWPGKGAENWLGWLEATKGAFVDLGALEVFKGEVARRGFRHALLLGMGGSSLGPEVLSSALGSAPGFPELLVLDSTDPRQVARVAGAIDPDSTLFIVASKSGSTLEPDVLHRYFFDFVARRLGPDQAGARFVAITDPGSKLEETARSQGFWRIFLGEPTIGGRFSVLSNFGMVPAAALGLDVAALFAAAQPMVAACEREAPLDDNPGFGLGALLGAAAAGGRDKVTVMIPEPLADLGAWLEQLVAESTGKGGKALIPVTDEPLMAPSDYGSDRLFVHFSLEGQSDPKPDIQVAGLKAAGHPVVEIRLAQPDFIVQEFVRWEIAIAVAGAVMGLNPFDQPDVESSKVKARALTAAFERAGTLPARVAACQEGALALFGDSAYLQGLDASGGASFDDLLAAHLGAARPGDYVALLAYMDRNATTMRQLRLMAEHIRARTGIATVVQFGPRYLHSTGQAYKGGPNSGVFLQLTVSGQPRLAIPGLKLDFATVEAAQAEGDFQVLVERRRRALRIDLGADVSEGLERLTARLAAAGGAAL